MTLIAKLNAGKWHAEASIDTATYSQQEHEKQSDSSEKRSQPKAQNKLCAETSVTGLVTHTSTQTFRSDEEVKPHIVYTRVGTLEEYKILEEPNDDYSTMESEAMTLTTESESTV